MTEDLHIENEYLVQFYIRQTAACKMFSLQMLVLSLQRSL